jgi:hypothetical protein
MNKLYVVLTILVLLALTFPVYSADDDENVELQNFPQRLSERLGLPTTGNYFVGRILASGIILMLFLLPTVFACTKFGKDVMFPSLFVGFIAFGFCIALGWLDWWFLLVISMIVAFMFAGRMGNLIGGGGGS